MKNLTLPIGIFVLLLWLLVRPRQHQPAPQLEEAAERFALPSQEDGRAMTIREVHLWRDPQQVSLAHASLPIKH